MNHSTVKLLYCDFRSEQRVWPLASSGSLHEHSDVIECLICVFTMPCLFLKNLILCNIIIIFCDNCSPLKKTLKNWKKMKTVIISHVTHMYLSQLWALHSNFAWKPGRDRWNALVAPNKVTVESFQWLILIFTFIGILIHVSTDILCWCLTYNHAAFHADSHLNR